MTARRVTHLLWTEPRLLVQKLSGRLSLFWQHINAARQARSQAASIPRTGTDGTDPLLMLAEALPVVVIERRKNFVACGLRATDAPLLLERIRQRWPDARLLIDGKPATFGLAAIWRDTLRTKTISLVART